MRVGEVLKNFGAEMMFNFRSVSLDIKELYELMFYHI